MDNPSDDLFRRCWTAGNPFYEAAKAACDERLTRQKHEIRTLKARLARLQAKPRKKLTKSPLRIRFGRKS